MKIFFVSLGCDKNKVDSEKILKFFMEKGKNVEVVFEPVDADVAIVNTCSFIRDAKNESINWIKYLVSLKKKKRIKKILVLGCFATEYKKNNDNLEVANLFNYVDAVLPFEKYLNDLSNMKDRVLDILSFSSFLKICDGCNKFCTYCIIPYLRGRFVSNTIENIVEEAKILAKNGVKEVSIVGQDILSYGKDIYGEKKLSDLIEKITKISGIEWIRLLYCYPEEIDDNLIYLIKNNKKVLHYIDMPIQHSSDKILKLMNRKTTNASIKKIINKLRSEIPDIVIRTTIMVGFPGETEEDFNNLLKFVNEIKFDKLGVFAYSREKLSKSYNYPNQVENKIKIKRQKQIMTLQKKIAIEKNKNYIGKIYYSLVEGYDNYKKAYIVRPYFNARKIDDNVYVKSKNVLLSGSFVNVKIIEIDGMNLKGEIV